MDIAFHKTHNILEYFSFLDRLSVGSPPPKNFLPLHMVRPYVFLLNLYFDPYKKWGEVNF
jgi:hypothetical protein